MNSIPNDLSFSTYSCCLSPEEPRQEIKSVDGVTYQGFFNREGYLTEGTISYPDKVETGRFDKNVLIKGIKTILSSGTTFDGDFINGEIVEGKVTHDGKIYVGQFERNWLIRGSIVDAQKNCYKGIFNQHCLVEGSLSMRLNGNLYEFEVKTDFFNGQIDPQTRRISDFALDLMRRFSPNDPNKKIIYSEGFYIFKDGFFKACVKYSNGTIFNGVLNHNLEPVEGCKILSDKSSYEGRFTDNMLNGEGKKTIVNKESSSDKDFYEGEFKNDQLNGFGKKVISTTRSSYFQYTPSAKDLFEDYGTYEGEFKDDRLLFGSKTAFGFKVEGTFEDDKPSGDAKLTIGLKLTDLKNVLPRRYKRSISQQACDKINTLERENKLLIIQKGHINPNCTPDYNRSYEIIFPTGDVFEGKIAAFCRPILYNARFNTGGCLKLRDGSVLYGQDIIKELKLSFSCDSQEMLLRLLELDKPLLDISKGTKSAKSAR